eukprot:g10845.t1
MCSYSGLLYGFYVPYFILHCFILSCVPHGPFCVPIMSCPGVRSPYLRSQQPSNQPTCPTAFSCAILHDLTFCRSTYPQCVVPWMSPPSCLAPALLHCGSFSSAGYSSPLLQSLFTLFTSTALALAQSCS